MSITVVGLGCMRGDLTERGFNAIIQSDFVIARTQKTDSIKSLEDKNIKYISLDNLYDEADNFDALNKSIADAVISYSKKGNVVYCVEGAGFDDESVRVIAQDCEIVIIEGVSREASASAKIQFIPSVLTGISAVDFVNERAFFAPYGTLVIKELDSKFLASDVKLKVLEIYGERDLFFLSGNKATRICALEIDRQEHYGHDASLVVTERSYMEKQRFSFEDLMAVVYRLRAKDGCKWDREQTHNSIKINCIEEAYELIEAIDLEDIDKMVEESGDVLLQGIFHAIIAEDYGEYTITDVLTTLSKKLLDRHTHIFGKDVANTGEEALNAWERAKAKEKNQISYTERMKQVANTLPALIRANKVQKIAKKANFDWESADGAIAKLLEEIEELKTASLETREEEGGDLLFAAVNVLRHFKVEPELALFASINKFMDRFSKVERKVAERGKLMQDCTLYELDAIYTEIKNADR